MKKTILILLIQAAVFYFYPLVADPQFAMDMTFTIIITTFILAIFMGCFAGKKIKKYYPVLVMVMFIPSIFIYYNASAIDMGAICLAVAVAGEIIGIVLSPILQKVVKSYTKGSVAVSRDNQARISVEIESMKGHSDRR